MSSFRPVDEDARERARRDHVTSLVLEAGAGTGKTTLLVDRIEAIVRAGAARLEEIAAVTFTENAATTMKLRLRERLERARSDAQTPEAERARVTAALEVIERASVSTIHALCAQVLQERPLECGVLPAFRMADEAQADAIFAEAWEEWLGDRLVGGDEVLLDALDSGIPLEGDGWGERTSLRGLARTLIDQRDLVPVAADGAFSPRRRGTSSWRRAHAPRRSRRREGGRQPRRRASSGSPPSRRRRASSRATPSSCTCSRSSPSSPTSASGPTGPRPRRSPKAARSRRGRRSARASWAACAARTSTGGSCGRWGRRPALRAEEGRARRLDFLDLLLMARDALRDHAGVREWYRLRFRFLVIDEFQDTDPLQVEVARLLSGDRPGALVVVGDAKQSIYRFRRAEVRLFRELCAGPRPLRAGRCCTWCRTSAPGPPSCAS